MPQPSAWLCRMKKARQKCDKNWKRIAEIRLVQMKIKMKIIVYVFFRNFFAFQKFWKIYKLKIFIWNDCVSTIFFQFLSHFCRGEPRLNAFFLRHSQALCWGIKAYFHCLCRRRYAKNKPLLLTGDWWKVCWYNGQYGCNPRSPRSQYFSKTTENFLSSTPITP